MGVDIFFVLSGFLIAFVLNREYSKYEDIDWYHFMRMRFLRIFPGMCSLLVAAFFFFILIGSSFGDNMKFILPAIFFVANLVGSKIHKSHLWSVCVEM
jgi:peptidoglycan/LPS O-acetylase OafA/YrhL